MRWTHIMLHHSLTKDSQTVSWGAIRRYHTGEKGWSDIGYHYGVDLVNEHYEILIGRSLLREGAHCYQSGMNRRAVGVCLIGNFDDQMPPEPQIKTALGLVKTLMELFRIPVHNVVAHRDYAPKSCPGKFFDMEGFRARL